MIIIETVAQYLATQTAHPYGKSCFSYELPDNPAECIGVLGVPTNGLEAPAQIDAATIRLEIIVRSTSNSLANKLAQDCYNVLNPADEEGERTGFVELLQGLYVYCFLNCEPVWSKTDQQGRKYFTFQATITASRQK